MKILRYVSGLLFVLLLLTAAVLNGQSMFARWFYLLTGSGLFALTGFMLAGTDPGRILAFKAASVALVGFCAILSISTGEGLYMDIAIAWTLQSYIATLFLYKNISGENRT